jgi:aminotransferase EvaB
VPEEHPVQIPFNDPVRQTTRLGGAVEEAIARVIGSGWFILGPENEAFETAFAEYCGVGHCVGVANGTDALEIALRAVGCAPGDEVVTVANAGMYATAATISVGATPVFVDIDPDTLLVSPEAAIAAIGPKTRAVVVTHLYGLLADIGPIVCAARSVGAAVIEDCAQAHGASRDGRMAGSFGDIATFSFYPTKNLGAVGDAGALVTDDEVLAARARSLRQYGWESKYHATVPGGRNSRLDEMQAAVLLAKLPHLDAWNEQRRTIVSRYREASAGTLLTMHHIPASDFVAHLAVGTHPDRRAFCERMAAAGVATAFHFPIPDHLQPALRGVAWRSTGLTVTEKAAAAVVSLPCFPEMTEDEVAHVGRALEASA